MYLKVYATQIKVNELENQQIKSFTKLLKKLTKVQKTVHRAAMAPVVRRRPVARASINNAGDGGLGPAN